MFCSNCGKEVSENAQFCMYCGAKIYIDQSMTSDHIANQMSQSVSSKNENNTPKSLHVDNKVIMYGKHKIGHVYSMVALVFIVVAVFVIIGIIKINQSNKYNDAIEAYKNNDMDKALKLFKELGDYKYASDYKEMVELRNEYDKLTIEKADSTSYHSGTSNLKYIQLRAGGLEDLDDLRIFRNRVNASYEANDYIKNGKYQEAYESLKTYSGEINTLEADLYNAIYFDTFALIEIKKFMWEYLGEDINNIDRFIRFKWVMSFDENDRITIAIELVYGDQTYQLICDDKLEYSAYSGDSGNIIDDLLELDLYKDSENECLISKSKYLYKDEIQNALAQGEISNVPIGKYYYNDKNNNNKITEGK